MSLGGDLCEDPKLTLDQPSLVEDVVRRKIHSLTSSNSFDLEMGLTGEDAPWSKQTTLDAQEEPSARGLDDDGFAASLLRWTFLVLLFIGIIASIGG